MGKRKDDLERIDDYRRRFRELSSADIERQLNFGSLIKEAQIALRQVLEERTAGAIESNDSLVTDSVTEPNSAIELHDSTLVAVTVRDSALVLVLSPAILHRSEGRPGVDAGSTWLQDVEIVIDQALAGFQCDAPLEVSGGILVAGSGKWNNVVPIPLQESGPVTLDLELSGVPLVRIQGRSISILGCGPARFLESFSGG